MDSHRFISGIIPLTAALAFSGIVSSCSAPASVERASVELGLQVRKTQLSRSAGSSFVSVVAEGDWTLAFETPVDWARLSDISGSGSKANIVLSWDANTGAEERSLTLLLSDGRKVLSERMVQAGADKPEPARMESDPIGGWMEISSLPGDTYFITHPMTIDDKLYRNYSFCWDIDNLLAHWVAYPLNSTLLKGSCGRTDGWSYDPKVPKEFQPCYAKGIDGYDRGHQIPSADRQIAEYNRQTFYYTNMTPQTSSLNTKTWANLESYVRDRSYSVDTLYVVSGCVVDDHSAKAYDNNGKEVTVPSGYFKALLAYSKSYAVGSGTGGYAAIAFYFDNKSCPGSYFDYSMTVDELEELTGIDFFVNLPSAIGRTQASKVESTVEKWWK